VLDQLGIEMPLVDLLVRETIQNALDAAAGAPVRVDFHVRRIPSSDVLGLLEGCGSIHAPAETCILLEISDSGTTGLGGPTRMADCSSPADFGQFIRLVYSMGVNQQAKGAGGSHGIGKSIFYHLGAGLAFFHSRVPGGSQGSSHRLAACWVEDQLLTTGQLPFVDGGSISTGVCWWGHGSDEKIPIEDTRTCLQVLDVLGAPFRDSDGTSIIVPFLDMEKLDCPTTEQLCFRIREAVCRWYFPRLWNSGACGTSGLEVHVDGIAVTPGSLPGVERMQRVHAAALDHDGSSEGIQVRPVLVNGIEPEAGWLAWMSTPPSAIPRPLDSNRESGQSLALVRKPGMVIRYHNADAWISSHDFGSDLFAVFQSNPDATIQPGKSQELPLEEYLRACESGNHHGWEHRHEIGEIHLGERQNYVNRIRKAIRAILDPEVRPPREVFDTSPDLGRKLGRLILPEGFGQQTRPSSASKSGHASRAQSTPEVTVEGIDIAGTVATLSIQMRLPVHCAIHVEPQADLGGRWLGPGNLGRMIGGALPFRPLDLKVVSWRTRNQQGAHWKQVHLEGTSIRLLDRAGQQILAIDPVDEGWKFDGADDISGGVVLSARMKVEVSDPRIRIGVGWRMLDGRIDP